MKIKDNTTKEVTEGKKYVARKKFWNFVNFESTVTAKSIENIVIRGTVPIEKINVFLIEAINISSWNKLV